MDNNDLQPQRYFFYVLEMFFMNFQVALIFIVQIVGVVFHLMNNKEEDWMC